MTDTASAVIREDTPGLLDWAAGVRGQDWADRLSPALAGALDAGWDWTRRATMACRLILSPDGDPKEMTDAARNFRRDSAAQANPHAWADKARRMTEQVRAERSAASQDGAPPA